MLKVEALQEIGQCNAAGLYMEAQQEVGQCSAAGVRLRHVKIEPGDLQVS